MGGVFSHNEQERLVVSPPPRGGEKIYLTRTNHNSRIDSAVLLSLKVILPLLFFATFPHIFSSSKALPPHLVLGISVTFGILAVVTAVFLLHLHVSRLY